MIMVHFVNQFLLSGGYQDTRTGIRYAWFNSGYKNDSLQITGIIPSGQEIIFIVTPDRYFKT